MSKEAPTKISQNLTIPGFDVKVGNDGLSCEVKSQDGRHEFSVEIDESNKEITISGPMFDAPLVLRIGLLEGASCQYITSPDNTIAQVANSLRLMDKLSSEGFSAKIDGYWLVLSHPSKPRYLLCMGLGNARKIVPLKNTSLYTDVEYYGPAYNGKEATKAGRREGWALSNLRLVAIDQDFEKFCQEIKTRILNLGEEKDPRIAQWVSEEIEKELRSQGFTFIPKPEKGVVDFFHPSGVSGSIAFAPFTRNAALDFNSKYPNLRFPTDIEPPKVVLLTCAGPNHQEPYSRAFLVTQPQEVINDIRGHLAIALVHQEVCNTWKSDILVPNLKSSRLQLVNPKLEGQKALILDFSYNYHYNLNEKLRLYGMGEELFYSISDTPTCVDTKAITQTIVERAEKHVQEFYKETGENRITEVIEVDLD